MNRQMALIICALGVLGIFVLFGLLETGVYEALARGFDVEIADIMQLFAPSHYYKSMIAIVIALSLLWYDLFCLFTRVKTDRIDEPQPWGRPIPYALLRMRRYCLVAFVMAYSLVLIRVLKVNLDHPWIHPFSRTSMIVFACLVLESRRPLNWTHKDVSLMLLELVKQFSLGFGGHRG